jgi:hypothetical protein
MQQLRLVVCVALYTSPSGTQNSSWQVAVVRAGLEQELNEDEDEQLNEQG